MRNSALNGYSTGHTLGLNNNLKVIFGITELDFHLSSASLSFNITNVGTQVQNPPGSNTFIERLNFRLRIFNQTVMYKIAVDVAIIRDQDIDEIYILRDQFNCQVLNQGIGYRSENYTFQISTASKPDFQPQVRQMYAALYYRGFNLFNPNGSYFYLNWQFYYNHTDYTIVFHTQDENLVSFVHFQVIVVDINDVYQRKDYTRYFFIDMVNCSNISVQTCPGKLAQFSFPNYQPTFKSYLFGLTKLNFTKHQRTNWFIDTNNIGSLDPGYTQTYSLKWANLTVFIIAQLYCTNNAEYYDPETKNCVANCPAKGSGIYFLNTGVNVNSTKLCRKCHYSCQPNQCGATGDNQCDVCNASKFRQPDPAAGGTAPYKCLCMSGHIDVGLQYCPPCSHYIPGCLQCSSTTVCTTCDANMFITANDKCQCSLVQTTSRYGTCQGIVGCLVYFNDPVRSTVCIECNITQNFVLYNYTCICIAGYELQSIGGRWVCVPLAQVCGDGIRTINEQCDDFNTFNKDGCNSTCQIEVGFLCFGNLRETSFCIENISKISYVGAMKIQGQTTADLYFQLWPYNQKLEDIGILTKYLRTSISNFSSMRNLQIFTQPYYVNDILRIRLRYDYTQDVNPNVQHNLSLLVYDRQKQYQVQTKFHIVGANLKLEMVESSSNIIPLNYVMLVLVILAFIAMFISLFTNNWIGIELLHTYQFCFFYYVLLGNIDQKQYKYLNFLQFCNGFNRITDYFSYYEYVDFNRKIYLLDFSKQILVNFNFTALLFCIPVILLVWKMMRNLPSLYSRAKKSRGTSEASQYRSRSPKLDQILSSEFIVGKLFITFNLIFMNIIIFSFFIEQTHFLQEDQNFNRIFQQFYLFALVTSVIVTVGLLILAAVKPFSYDEVSLQDEEDAVGYVKFKRFSPTYPIIYTSVIGMKIIFVSLFVSDNYSPYILLAIEILYLIGFLLVRPYKRVRNFQIKYCYPLHNLHNIWNSIGLIVLISVLIVANSNGNSSTYSMNTTIKVIILVVELISLIFAYMRLFVSKRLARIARNIEKQKQIQKSPLDGLAIQDTDRTLRRNTSSIRKGSIGQKSQSRVQQQKINNRPRQPTGNSFRSNSPSRNKYYP